MIWIRIVPGWPIFDQLGRYPTVAGFLALPAAFLMTFWLFLFFLKAGGKMPWYERAKLVEGVPLPDEG